VAAEDLTAARILEAHADALAILAEEGEPPPAGTWGVFAAEAPDVALIAREAGAGWIVEGTKSWCSLGGRLDFALVTARVGSARRLFAVDLHHGSVHAAPPSGWVARGLRAIPSGPVHFAGTPARPIGGPSWYFTRPGFSWGGIGVAACWYGGARALADRLLSNVAKQPGDVVALSVGAVDVVLHAAWTWLIDVAHHVDAQTADRDGELLALRVRSVVADAAERVLSVVGHALGPAPLALDETHARRVADLEIYVRQHHAERDLADLGHRLIDRSTR
jgi:alkylation response protein AidB-like acyl-CoA dehydrogenase